MSPGTSAQRVTVPTRGTVYVVVTQFDSATLFDVQLLGKDALGTDVPQSLAGVDRVTFSMVREIDRVYVQEEEECDITNVDEGRVNIRPVVAERGLFRAQFHVYFADGTSLSFPNGWDLYVRVRRDVTNSTNL